MSNGKDYELVNGRLVERNSGAESSWVGGRICLRLSKLCDEHHLGWVWPADNGYQCFAHAPKLVRRPDVSFIRAGRLRGDALPSGFVRIAPDLAVEVVSPNDLAPELDEKLEDLTPASPASTELRNLSATYGEKYPEIHKVKDEIAKAEAQRTQLVADQKSKDSKPQPDPQDAAVRAASAKDPSSFAQLQSLIAGEPDRD